jgi:hypothetical protein
MNATFKANDFHTIDATFGVTIAITVTDLRVPDEKYVRELSLETYNKLVSFFRDNDHRYAVTMAKTMFR